MNECINFYDHEIFLIKSINDTFLLYAPTLKLLIRIKNTLAARLMKKGLLTTDEDDTIKSLINMLIKAKENPAKPFSPATNKSKYFHIAFGLTRNCSLACIYCHADAGYNKNMRRDILEDSIKYAFSKAKADDLIGINTSFAVGGEPTVNWDLFTYCIDTLKKYESIYNIPVHLSMTTNGYYGQDKRDYIAKYFDNILISLDGPADIQNLHRPSKNGKETFDTVIDSAKFFNKKIKSFAVRATISNKSVQRMPEIVDFVYNNFGKGSHLVVEPLVPLGRAITNKDIIDGPSQEDFVKYYIQSKEKALDFGIELITSASNYKRLVTSFCGAMSIPSFTVTTDGIITTCERDSEGVDYWYAKYNKSTRKFDFDKERINKNISLLKMPDKCKSCFCKYHCAGDCPDVRNINYDRCYVNKMLIKYELEKIANTK